MTKWEYTIRTTPSADDRDELLAALEKYGLEGWELCTLEPAHSLSTRKPCSIAVLKRPSCRAADAPTESVEAGAPGDEIEVTPEMIDAGLGPLFRFHRERSDEKDVVTEIFQAMSRAAKK